MPHKTPFLNRMPTVMSLRSRQARPPTFTPPVKSELIIDFISRPASNMDCPICLEEKPLLALDCSHGLCQPCLTRLLAAVPDDLICPTCRAPSFVPGDTRFNSQVLTPDIIRSLSVYKGRALLHLISEKILPYIKNQATQGSFQEEVPEEVLPPYAAHPPMPGTGWLARLIKNEPNVAVQPNSNLPEDAPHEVRILNALGLVTLERYEAGRGQFLTCWIQAGMFLKQYATDIYEPYNFSTQPYNFIGEAGFSNREDYEEVMEIVCFAIYQQLRQLWSMRHALRENPRAFVTAYNAVTTCPILSNHQTLSSQAPVLKNICEKKLCSGCQNYAPRQFIYQSMVSGLGRRTRCEACQPKKRQFDSWARAEVETRPTPQ